VSRPFTSPLDQRATFVELFFDLVFVYGVTQIVGLLHHDLSWAGVGRGILVFWLVWWAWTQFTWALNAADTTHPLVELLTLVSTAVAFLMSVAIPTSFAGRALWFAVPYVLVRVLGLWIYAVVARASPGQHAAVRLFALVSTGGLTAVIAGAVAGPAAQPWLWGLAIFLDVLAAVVGGQQKGWDIHAEHFSERHGLIVIIALGESLIVAAAGLGEVTLTGDVVAVALTGVLVSCALWWTYFPVAKPELEHALASAPAEQQGALARDAFSLAHFPMLCGVVAYAVALEEAVAHPGDPLATAGRTALALGPVLFVGGTALAMWRATCGQPVTRVLLTAGTGATVLALPAVPAPVALALTLAGVVLVAALDERRASRLSQTSPRPR
jgi:low temperature requirement protein LtrA